MKKNIYSTAILMMLTTGMLFSQPGNGSGWYGQGNKGYARNIDHNNRREDRGMRDGRGLMQLPDLTDEQISQIEALKVTHIKETKTLKESVDVKQLELRSLQTAESADMSQVNKKIEEIGKIRIDLEKKKAAHHQQVRSILTEDQRIIFDTQSGRRGVQRHQRGNRN